MTTCGARRVTNRGGREPAQEEVEVRSQERTGCRPCRSNRPMMGGASKCWTRSAPQRFMNPSSSLHRRRKGGGRREGRRRRREEGKKEKEKVIKKRLLDLKLKLRILEPKVFFPIVGGYIVSGKYSVLNKYIAQPSYDQITELLKNENYLIFEIAGKKKIIEKHGKWLLKKDKFSKAKFHMEKIIKRYLNKKYFYFNHYKNISIKDIDYLFFKSYANYKKKLTRFPIATNWKAEFCIYKNLFINSQGKINLKDSKYLKKYSIKNRRSSNKSLRNDHSKLKCHLDFNLFYGLLKRKYTNWNQPASGSLILYERKPNIFDPNLLFSLNYFNTF